MHILNIIGLFLSLSTVFVVAELQRVDDESIVEFLYNFDGSIESYLILLFCVSEIFLFGTISIALSFMIFYLSLQRFSMIFNIKVLEPTLKGYIIFTFMRIYNLLLL